MRAIAIVAVMCLAAPRAWGEPEAPMKPETREHFERGLQHYRDKEYDAAVREFELAWAIEERAELLFAMAQAERLSGDCGSASILYRKFLDTDPEERHAEAARSMKERCDRALATRPELVEEARPVAAEPSNDAAQDAATPPVVEPVAPPAVAPPVRDEGRPWYRDPIGVTLAGAGVTALAVGGTFFALSVADASDAESADSYTRYVELIDRAEQRRTIAWVGVGAGAGLLTAAALRYWVFDGDDRGSDLAVSITGRGVGIAGTF